MELNPACCAPSTGGNASSIVETKGVAAPGHDYLPARPQESPISWHLDVSLLNQRLFRPLGLE